VKKGLSNYAQAFLLMRKIIYCIIKEKIKEVKIVIDSGFLVEIWIGDTFKNLIKNGRYEILIGGLMNASKYVFEGEYEHIESQANGECDFVEKNTRKKFDAKLCFNKSEGKMIGAPKGEMIKWLEEMNEYFADVKPYSLPQELKIYKFLKDKLNTIKDDENLIVYIPFPMMLDIPEVCNLLTSTTLDIAVEELKNEGITKGRQIFAIFPINNGMALYDIEKNLVEKVNGEEFEKHLFFKRKSS